MESQSGHIGYKSCDPELLLVPDTFIRHRSHFAICMISKVFTWWPYPIVVTTVKEKKRELC